MLGQVIAQLIGLQTMDAPSKKAQSGAYATANAMHRPRPLWQQFSRQNFSSRLLGPSRHHRSDRLFRSVVLGASWLDGGYDIQCAQECTIRHSSQCLDTGAQ